MSKVNKKMSLIVIVLGFAGAAIAEPGPGFPNLSETQRQCLESKLGKPNQGERPSREKAEAAFQSCGISRDQMPHEGVGRPKGPPPGLADLTSDQRECLKGYLGEPGSGERPSREKMESALSKCGIQISKEESFNSNSSRRAKTNSGSGLQ